MTKQERHTDGISSFLIDDRYHVHRHLIVQVVILAISVGIFFDAPDRLNLSLNRLYGWVSYFLFLNMLLYINMYVLFPCFLARNRVFAYIFSTVLFTLFALFVMVLLQELFYDIAVTRQQPSDIALFLSIASSMATIFLFLGGISTLMLLKQWTISNRNLHNLQAATFQSELYFLKSQVNPHFLFNMINNANIMVDEEPETASYILNKLDDMLRYQLNDSTHDRVSLKADITFLTDFLDLEKLRRDHFEYSVEVEGNLEEVRVPPLLFIPFVENAVKHNREANRSYVYIRFKRVDHRLLFECENSKPAKLSRQDVGGLGLANIKRRLDLLFENKYAYDLRETETTYIVNLELSI